MPEMKLRATTESAAPRKKTPKRTSSNRLLVMVTRGAFASMPEFSRSREIPVLRITNPVMVTSGASTRITVPPPPPSTMAPSSPLIVIGFVMVTPPM